MPEGQQELALIPNATIRSSTFWYDKLIFDQLHLIKIAESEVFKSPKEKRTDTVLALFQTIRGLETIIWGKIEKSEPYREKREAAKPKEKDFEELLKGGVIGQLQFMDKLDEWQKVLALYLRAFNFYPATSVDFISGKGIKEKEE